MTWIAQSAAQASANQSSTDAGSFGSMFVDLGQKVAAGFNVSTADFLGRDFAYELLPGPRGGLNATWSSIANQSKLLSHQFPLSMVQANALEVDDPVFFGYQIPLANSTFVSLGALTLFLIKSDIIFQYEFTPFEFGSWDSRVDAFTPMEWTGTQLQTGLPVNSSACVLGFDRAR